MPEFIIAASMIMTTGSALLAGLALVSARDAHRKLEILAEQVESIDDFLERVTLEAEHMEQQMRQAAQQMHQSQGQWAN